MGTPMSKTSDDEYEQDESEDFDEEIERDDLPKYDSQCPRLQACSAWR